MSDTDELRYPIGRMPRTEATLSAAERERYISSIEKLPRRLRAAVAAFTPERWQTPYRPGGWTVHQLVHHIPDSHVNAYTRFKLALTEDMPTIKPYDEAKWAELPDGKSRLVEESLMLLEALHARWVFLLRRMQPADFARKLNHPDWETPLSLDQMLALYSWHCRHHVAHITTVREKRKW